MVLILLIIKQLINDIYQLATFTIDGLIPKDHLVRKIWCCDSVWFHLSHYKIHVFDLWTSSIDPVAIVKLVFI